MQASSEFKCICLIFQWSPTSEHCLSPSSYFLFLTEQKNIFWVKKSEICNSTKSLKYFYLCSYFLILKNLFFRRCPILANCINRSIIFIQKDSSLSDPTWIIYLDHLFLLLVNHIQWPEYFYSPIIHML